MKCIIKRVKSRRNIEFLLSDGCFTLIFCFTISYFTILFGWRFKDIHLSTHNKMLFKLHLLIQKKHINRVTFCLFTCALHIQTKRCRCSYPTVLRYCYTLYCLSLLVYLNLSVPFIQSGKYSFQPWRTGQRNTTRICPLC